MQLTELPMVCCGWLSCLCMACVFGGPFCWLFGTGGRGCGWADMTPKLPLVGSLGPAGRPFEKETIGWSYITLSESTKSKYCNNTGMPVGGKTLQDIIYLFQRCYSTSRMWSRLLPLQMKKGKMEGAFFSVLFFFFWGRCGGVQVILKACLSPDNCV